MNDYEQLPSRFSFTITTNHFYPFPVDSPFDVLPNGPSSYCPTRQVDDNFIFPLRNNMYTGVFLASSNIYSRFSKYFTRPSLWERQYHIVRLVLITYLEAMSRPTNGGTSSHNAYHSKEPSLGIPTDTCSTGRLYTELMSRVSSRSRR